MVDVKFIEEQLRELAKRSRTKAGISKWTGLNEFIYSTFTGLQVQDYSETFFTLQTAEEMTANLEDHLNEEDYEVLKEERTDDRIIVYIRTLPHLSTIGYGALVAVELKDQQARITIYEHDIPSKSIDTYDLMDYIAQTIVAPSKRSREIVVNKNILGRVYGMGGNRQIEAQK